MATVTKPLALDESLNSTENTPRNIADVLADELDGIKQAINSQSGSGNGHIIQNSSGANMPSENTMQFVDAHLSDDNVGGKTVVETFKAVTEAEYSSETEDGAYIITDGDGATIGPASEDYVEVVADGEKTWSQLLDELWTKVDTTKASFISVLIIDHSVFHMLYMGSSYVLSNCNITSQVPTVARINIRTSGSKYEYWNGTTYVDYSPNTATSGIEFHYGNKSAIVDLQTTANRCWYDSNTTVKQKIDAKADKNDSIIATVNSANKIATFPVDTTALYYVEIGVSSQNTSTAIIAISKLYSNICPYVLAEKYASDCQISSISMSGNNVVLTMSTQYFYNVYAKQITKLE